MLVYDPLNQEKLETKEAQEQIKTKKGGFAGVSSDITSYH
jgi:hypothetical protein